MRPFRSITQRLIFSRSGSWDPFCPFRERVEGPRTVWPSRYPKQSTVSPKGPKTLPRSDFPASPYNSSIRNKLIIHTTSSFTCVVYLYTYIWHNKESEMKKESNNCHVIFTYIMVSPCLDKLKMKTNCHFSRWKT